MARSTKAEKFAKSAIALMQSESMRAWASSERNFTHVVRAAGEKLAKQPKASTQDFCTMLTLIAMG